MLEQDLGIACDWNLQAEDLVLETEPNGCSLFYKKNFLWL